MFLAKILPPGGLYCVALLLKNGGFRHFFYPDLQKAQQQLNILDAGGNTVYIAQATFDPEKIAEAKAYNKTLPYDAPKSERKKIRGQINAQQIKNFFLDIDCGEKWPLKNQSEGITELKKFVTATGMSTPAVVNSGTGLYAHWILSEAISAKKWRAVAFLLKKIIAEYSPAIGGDSSRTSDSASVLRAVGSHNRKNGVAREVTLLHDADPISFERFVDMLDAAAKKKRISRTVILPPAPSKDINADFLLPVDNNSIPEKIADKCAQMALMRSTCGNVPEPLWYSCLGVLVFSADGAAVARDWSKGHSGYTQAETDAKFAQWRDSGMGPTTCVKFGSENPTGCVGCPHIGKIKSPIILGRPDPIVKQVAIEECPTPDGFRRAADGLYREEDEGWFKFYDYDLYPTCLAYDESLGYEVTILKHKLQYEGDMECVFRSSLVNDPKALLITLSDNHIKAVGLKEKKCMVAYLESYQVRLQRQRRMSMLLCQMGWKEARNNDTMFVLGRKIFRPNGSVEDASLAKNVPKAAEGYHSAGSLQKWVDATEVFNTPGMEPFAFALLAGGFGAPLMKFTGFAGALVSLVGISGVGKTLMLRMIQSVWGKHTDLMMLRDDTKNAMFSRLGVYNNLPLTVDEVTNIDSRALSDLVYGVTQGRDKARLTKNSEERRVLNSWNTLAVTTSNSSLLDKLSDIKHDAGAEIYRVFEYIIDKHASFHGSVTENLFWVIHDNYGHAGEVYAQWLVQNVDKVKNDLAAVRAQIESSSKVCGEERFWGAVASTAILGGLYAQKLGLLKFSPAGVLVWVKKTLAEMRIEKTELGTDSVSILGQFLDEHTTGRLIVKGNAMKKAGCTILEAPRGPLTIRYELDTGRLYISRSAFKAWLAKKFGSYSTVRSDLQKGGLLTHAGKRKTLGAGTFFGGTQQICWELNMNKRHIGEAGTTLVQVAALLEKAPIPGEEKCKLP